MQFKLMFCVVISPFVFEFCVANVLRSKRKCNELQLEPDYKSECTTSNPTEDTTCTIECNDQFVGRPVNINCDKNGEFQPGRPLCKRKCNALQLEPDYKSECTTSNPTEDTTCTIECNDQFVGESIDIKCNRNGDFTIDRPTCKRQCNPLQLESRLKSDCTTSNPTESTVCTIECQDPFIGQPISIKCDQIGQFPSERPTCERKCDKLELESHHKSDCNDKILTEGTHCTIECQDQFVGEPINIQCGKDGKFPPYRPTCKQRYSKTCDGAILEIPGGQQSRCTDGLNKDSVCTIICQPGFDINGQTVTTVTCKSDGVWDKQPIPTCQPSNCDATILSKEGIQVTDCQGSVLPGMECKIKCRDETYYLDEKDQGLKCIDGGKWNVTSIPECKKKCDATKLTKEGIQTTDCQGSVLQGKTCAIACSDGLELKGKKTVTCRKGGKWDRKIIPICKEVTTSTESATARTCPDVNEDDVLKPTGECVGATVGAVCEFRCVDPHNYLDGVTTVTCGLDGTWTPNAKPQCKPQASKKINNEFLFSMDMKILLNLNK